MAVTWLDNEYVIELNKVALFPGEDHYLNPGSNLEAALMRPRKAAYYGNVHSIIHLSAMYGVAITRAHPFGDGNKRTALLAVNAFLDFNGLTLDLSAVQVEAIRVFEHLATGDLSSKELANWLSKYTQSPAEAYSRIMDRWMRLLSDPDFENYWTITPYVVGPVRPYV